MSFGGVPVLFGRNRWVGWSQGAEAHFFMSLKNVWNLLVDSFIKLHQAGLSIPSALMFTLSVSVSACRMSARNCGLACEYHPCVHVSGISLSVTCTMLHDCQPFVHKHNTPWMPQSDPFTELLLWAFAVNINLFIQGRWIHTSGFCFCYGPQTKLLHVLEE